MRGLSSMAALPVDVRADAAVRLAVLFGAAGAVTRSVRSSKFPQANDMRDFLNTVGYVIGHCVIRSDSTRLTEATNSAIITSLAKIENLQARLTHPFIER